MSSLFPPSVQSPPQPQFSVARLAMHCQGYPSAWCNVLPLAKIQCVLICWEFLQPSKVTPTLLFIYFSNFRYRVKSCSQITMAWSRPFVSHSLSSHLATCCQSLQDFSPPPTPRPSLKPGSTQAGDLLSLPVPWCCSETLKPLQSSFMKRVPNWKPVRSKNSESQ